MNTLQDLRDTLGREADRVHDTDRYARPVAVRERIRVVRRRRAAVASVAAAAVVVAGVAVAGTLDGPDRVQPADRTVAGVDVPARVVVTGFPYRLDATASMTDRGRVHLDALDATGADRAVSLVATGLGQGYATLFRDGEPVARAGGDDDVELPVPVTADETTLRVRLDDAPAGARVGVAVYRSTGELADGVSNGTAVFRRTVAQDRLLTADFSEPGRQELTVRFTGALSDVRFSEYCRTDRRGYWLNVDLDGQGAVGTDCREDGRDPGTGWSAFHGTKVREHSLTAYFTRGSDGPRVAPPDGVLGLGVYELAGPPQPVLGLGVARTQEYDGRTWILDRVVRGAEDGRPVPVDATDGDRLVGFVARGRTAYLTWRGRLLHGESSRFSSAPGVGTAGSGIAGLLPRGDRYDVRLRGGGGPFAGAVLVYRAA